MMVIWWMILVFSAASCTALVAVLLPRVLLKGGGGASPPADRGVKDRREPAGRDILFQPAPALRKYVPQYVLSDWNGKKVIVCRLGENVSYLDYDVTLFNGGDAPFRVLRVKEVVAGRVCTREVELPEETAYVSLQLNEVNDKRLSRRAKNFIPKRRLAAFAALTGALIAAEAVLIKLCCARLFGGIFAESFMDADYGNSAAITALVCLAAAAVHLAAFFLLVKLRSRGRAEGENK